LADLAFTADFFAGVFFPFTLDDAFALVDDVLAAAFFFGAGAFPLADAFTLPFFFHSLPLDVHLPSH
jgi:hypothetical protein